MVIVIEWLIRYFSSPSRGLYHIDHILNSGYAIKKVAANSTIAPLITTMLTGWTKMSFCRNHKLIYEDIAYQSIWFNPKLTQNGGECFTRKGAFASVKSSSLYHIGELFSNYEYNYFDVEGVAGGARMLSPRSTSALSMAGLTLIRQR